jgi:hypothetical protein
VVSNTCHAACVAAVQLLTQIGGGQECSANEVGHEGVLPGSSSSGRHPTQVVIG